jgi:hypothetical protein
MTPSENRVPWRAGGPELVFRQVVCMPPRWAEREKVEYEMSDQALQAGRLAPREHVRMEKQGLVRAHEVS